MIERALTLDFIAEARNLILIGANGLGKTLLAKNIAYAAVTAGHSVLFRTASDLLYEVVNRRYERGSILITTNRAFKDWNAVFPNATCIATLLDRLTHHADITLIEGRSYRVRESELESLARKKSRSAPKSSNS